MINSREFILKKLAFFTVPQSNTKGKSGPANKQQQAAFHIKYMIFSLKCS